MGGVARIFQAYFEQATRAALDPKFVPPGQRCQLVEREAGAEAVTLSPHPSHGAVFSRQC